MTLSSADIDATIHRARWQQLRHRLLLGFFTLMAVANLVFAAYLLLTSRTGAFSALPALALTGLGSAMLARLSRAARREREQYAALASPVVNNVDRAIDATHAHLRSLRALRLIVLAVMLPLFAIALGMLWLQGRMNGTDVAAFVLLLLPIVSGVLVVIRHRIRNRLEPQALALKSLRAQLSD